MAAIGKYAVKLDSLRGFSQRRSPTPQFGAVHRGGYDSHIRTRRSFCTMHLPKFHHPMFTCSKVIVLTNKHTNKQMLLKTSNILRYATTLGN